MKKPNISSPNITELKDNEIFVFGSNSKGYHSAGAAKLAYSKFGAIWGDGSGLQGKSYAIQTMEGLERIKFHVETFIQFAKSRRETIFLVTEIGCGIAGYTPEDIAPLFKKALGIDNIHLPESFVKLLSNE